MNIVIGSLSALKVAAVHEACCCLGWNATITHVATHSGIATQPFGQEETLLGAQNRCRAAHLKDPMAYAIGIENGLRYQGDHYEDWAVIVIRTPDGRECNFDSDPVLVPSGLVDETRQRGFEQQTMGSILAERCGSPADDPHIFLTNGARSRRDILAHALVQAFVEILKHENH